MTTTVDLRAWRERQIENWLLLILRFAITRRLEDRVAAAALADQFGSLGVTRQNPEFFARTVCAAIEAPDDAAHVAILKTHLQRIDHPRLRRAFEAALGLGKASRDPTGRRKRLGQRTGLWAGLPDSRCGVLRRE